MARYPKLDGGSDFVFYFLAILSRMDDSKSSAKSPHDSLRGVKARRIDVSDDGIQLPSQLTSGHAPANSDDINP